MRQRGQSLVEFALILPILLVMLLGVFEVGYAIREYQVVLNASREGARYAIRPGVMNLETEETAAKSYNKIKEHTNLNLKGQNEIIISNIEIIPSQHCTGTYTIKNSEVITHYQSAVPNFNVNDKTTDLLKEDIDINCEREKRGSILTDDKMVVVEIKHQHHQLTGFFNWLNPMEFDVFTSMRILPQRDTWYLKNTVKELKAGDWIMYHSVMFGRVVDSQILKIEGDSIFLVNSDQCKKKDVVLQ